MAFGVDACSIQQVQPPTVISRSYVGERNEVANEMRLIEISGLDCKLSPIECCRVSDLADCMLESPYAGEDLRGQADFGIEQPDQASLTQTDRRGDISRPGLAVRCREHVERAANGAVAARKGGK